MLDLLKYFQEDKNTYSAQQIVLYNFDEQQSAHFIQDVLVPFREAFISNEKIVQMIDKYNMFVVLRQHRIIIFVRLRSQILSLVQQITSRTTVQ